MNWINSTDFRVVDFKFRIIICKCQWFAFLTFKNKYKLYTGNKLKWKNHQYYIKKKNEIKFCKEI